MQQQTQMFPRSALMLGCAPLGGLYHRDISFQHNVIPVLHQAILKHGIRDIDTAPWYGHGRAEKDLGKLLETDPLLEKETIRIYTKVGRVMKNRQECQESDPRCAFGDTCYKIDAQNRDVIPFHDYTDNGIRESIQQSLERLRILAFEDEHEKGTANKNFKKIRNPNHRIVSLRLHDCDEEDKFKEATKFGGIAELMKQCGTRYLNTCEPSIGMNSPEMILRILKWASSSSDAYRLIKNQRFTTVMMAGTWNLMDQTGLLTIEYCEKNDIQIHNAGIFGAGLLWSSSSSSNSYSSSEKVNYRYREATERELEKKKLWEQVATELGLSSLAALAVAFAFLPVPVTKLCFGAITASQVDGCVGAADDAMSKMLCDVGMMKKMIQLGDQKGLFDNQDGVLPQCMIWIERKSKMLNNVGGSSKL